MGIMWHRWRDVRGSHTYSISVTLLWKDKSVQIIDTADINQSFKQEQSNEINDLVVLDAMRSMKLVNVAVLVFDAQARYIQGPELTFSDVVVHEEGLWLWG